MPVLPPGPSSILQTSVSSKKGDIFIRLLPLSPGSELRKKRDMKGLSKPKRYFSNLWVSVPLPALVLGPAFNKFVLSWTQIMCHTPACSCSQLSPGWWWFFFKSYKVTFEAFLVWLQALRLQESELWLAEGRELGFCAMLWLQCQGLTSQGCSQTAWWQSSKKVVETQF